MNREQIIKAATAAGMTIYEGAQDRVLFDGSLLDALCRFADIVAGEEREACAEACEGMGALDAVWGEETGSAAMVRVADRQADLCAAAIRNRSSNPVPQDLTD